MNQAAFLKEFSRIRNPVTTIAVTSGKGGVGKTTIAIALSKFLADRGYRVCLVDGDLGLANVDIVLGLCLPKRTCTMWLPVRQVLRMCLWIQGMVFLFFPGAPV